MADKNVTVSVVCKMVGDKKMASQLSQIAEVTRDVEGASKDASSGLNVCKRAIDGVKKASVTAGDTLKQFVRSLGRILLYRTVRKILSETAQALKEGTKNLYAYSVAMNNTDSSQASKNLDSLATSILYVKNCLGSILAPVIQAITPIVYQMSEAFASASRNIAQLFSALTGNDTYTYALRFGTQLDKDLSNSLKSAKGIKRTLMGFDEINRLDAPDTSNSGSDFSAEDYGNMFDESKITKKIKSIANTIKKYVLPVISAIGTALVGVFIGNKIKNAVNSFAKALGGANLFGGKLGQYVASITLIVSGLALVVAGVKDVIETGGSLKSWCAILGGIALIVTGVAMTFGGIPALITGIVLGIGALALYIKTNQKEIKEKVNEVTKSIKTKLSEISTKIKGIPVIGTIWSAYLKFVEVKKKILVAIATIVAKVISQGAKLISPITSIWNKVVEIKGKIKQVIVALVLYINKKFQEKVLDKIMEKLEKFKDKIKKNFVEPMKKVLEPIVGKLKDFLSSIISKYVNGIFETIEKNLNKFIKALNKVIDKTNSLTGTKITHITELSIPRLATGGFVGQGQLFIANEMGAEMVGSMNGKTTVANNQQIVEGIKQGVMEAMKNGGNQNIILNVDGKQLFNILVDRNNSTVRTTGRSPLLV